MEGAVASHVAVERAISEIRAGRPVAIRSGRTVMVAVSVEALTVRLAAQLEKLARKTPRLVLPAPRLRRLGFDRDKPGVIAVPRVDLTRIGMLALELNARYDAPVAAALKLDL
ncbi:MAG: GTP cyclohydrolase, partial [Beijerinckiaceae bacterium]